MTLSTHKNSMKTALTAVLVAFLALSATAQNREMWVNTQSANLRDKPAASSHTMLKLGAPAQVTVLDSPKEYAKNPALKGKWVQVMFSPYPGGEMSWAGWMESRYLVAHRDSVKVPPAAALFTVPKDEKVFPTRVTVKGVSPAARSYNGRVRITGN
jgi:hypothetical protein